MISEDSDQTARMRSLIRVFADRTSLIVVFSCADSNDFINGIDYYDECTLILARYQLNVIK